MPHSLLLDERCESLKLRVFIARVLRRYPVSMRGRTRVTQLVHNSLFGKYGEAKITERLSGIPFELDLAEKAQTAMFYGVYEQYEVAFLRRTLHQGQFFVDVGANIGYYSAVALSRVGNSGAVAAFEPMPMIYERLRTLADHAKALGFNMIAEQKALSENAGQATLAVSKGSNIGCCTIVDSLMKDSDVKESYIVRTTRLDEFLEAEALEPPDIVKIDVEGAEDNVLAGMSKLFDKEIHPVLMIEPRDNNWDSVASILTPIGYRPFRCLKGGQLAPIDGLADAKCFLVVWKKV